MTTTDLPTVTIKQQSNTTTPTNSDSTIMDDTVMTMDGTAIMGGPVTIVEGTQSEVIVDELFTKLPRSS